MGWEKQFVGWREGRVDEGREGREARERDEREGRIEGMRIERERPGGNGNELV